MQIDRSYRECIRRTVGTDGWRLRRAHMARGMIGLAMVVILTAMLPSPAGAQQLGDFCWSLNPLSIPYDWPSPKGGQVIELHGRWLANTTAGQQAAGGAGPATYQVLGAGTATASVT